MRNKCTEAAKMRLNLCRGNDPVTLLPFKMTSDSIADIIHPYIYQRKTTQAAFSSDMLRSSSSNLRQDFEAGRTAYDKVLTNHAM
jgi:hypothetical protein